MNRVNRSFRGNKQTRSDQKVGLSTMIALPIISSLLAPTSAMAQLSTTCGSGSGPQDTNGTAGNGQSCPCNGSGTPSGLRACNTTRGGDSTGFNNGCRAGCFCRSASTSSVADRHLQLISKARSAFSLNL